MPNPSPKDNKPTPAESPTPGSWEGDPDKKWWDLEIYHGLKETLKAIDEAKLKGSRDLSRILRDLNDVLTNPYRDPPLRQPGLQDVPPKPEPRPTPTPSPRKAHPGYPFPSLAPAPSDESPTAPPPLDPAKKLPILVLPPPVLKPPAMPAASAASGKVLSGIDKALAEIAKAQKSQSGERKVSSLAGGLEAPVPGEPLPYLGPPPEPGQKTQGVAGTDAGGEDPRGSSERLVELLESVLDQIIKRNDEARKANTRGTQLNPMVIVPPRDGEMAFLSRSQLLGQRRLGAKSVNWSSASAQLPKR